MRILILCLIIVCNFSFSQTLKGKVQNTLKEPISANILIKNSENKNLISEFFKTDDNGDFTAVLEENYTKIYFEITAMGYEKIADSIISPSKNRTYNLNYILNEKITELQEVIVSQEKFEIEGDTVSFNPRSYKDGTERKVEDLIKKLPGMEVEENGSIKYRGKKVTSVQLEGDDLFGYNYAMGTRNISVDMVEQVQAIDNYSANPLLKGIENSEEVAINLKLKKGKLDISGNGNLGSGFDNNIDPRNDLSFNLLGISKKYKSFSSISYNNVGLNNSAEDYFSMSASLEDIQNEDFYAKKIIPENIFMSNFDTQRANINNQLAVSNNLIYRFSQKLSLKANISFLNDKITFLEDNNTFFNTENINYNDQSETIKKPINKQLGFKLTYNTSKVSLLEIETAIQDQKINTSNSIVQNNNTFFNTSLKTENIFWNNKIQYTYKISNNKALQYISNFSINAIPQELNIYPISFSFNGNLQKSEFEKKYYSNKFVLLGNSKKNKYVFTLGSVFENNPFNSNLFENNSSINPDFINQFNYKKATLFSEFGTTYALENWKFQPTLRISSINQTYKNDLESTNKTMQSFIVIPSLNISYSLSGNSTFKLTGSYEEKTPNEEYLFTNLIAQNNRFIRRNILDLNLQQNQNYILSYRYNNLFTAFSTNLSLIYNNNKNTYLSSIEIQDNFTISTFFQSPTNIENYSLNFGIEKYVNFLNSNIKHVSNYGINNYKNVVNQSDLRNNQSRNYNAYFFITTVFNFPINFQNKFNYSNINFISDNQNSNTNISFNNNLKMLIKPNNKFLFTISYDYFKPNTKLNEDFTFLDFEIKYKPKKMRFIEFWLTGKNLLNNTFFSQTENTDFQNTTYQSSLMPRYFLLTLDFKL
ncbi:hypothetical protein [Flavobacterium sp.]|uniref:hypothetical protein n=2 Tax=Flavobacterium sp. TaxID=239 RepID=UPI004048DF0E